MKKIPTLLYWSMFLWCAAEHYHLEPEMLRNPSREVSELIARSRRLPSF